MRHSDVTAGQRTCFGQNRKIPPGLQDNLVLTNEFRHPVTTSIKRVIFNLSELAGYWAHMMRKGTGAPFVIMPDGREGKMVLEYVRWWHQLTFSYFEQGINKLLTFKEQQLPDQERVGSRSPPSPEPTYGPIPEQGQPPRSSQHRKGHQPSLTKKGQTRTMKGKGGSAPVSQHASPIREERRSPIISSAPFSAQRMVTRSMRARQTQPARSHLRSRVVSRNGSIRVYSFSSSTGYTGIASITSTICSTQGT